MIEKNTIHAMILTFNEEMHLARCIESIQNYCTTINVIDSGSTDSTLDIAKRYSCYIFSNEWVNHSGQVNFGINKLSNMGGWIFRIDADEILDDESENGLYNAVEAAGDDIDGILVQRRIYFLDRRMRYGAIEPSWQLRLWRNGKGYCERRWMDEHIKVIGRTNKSKLILSDINLNSITWWTAKHNDYASREAIDILSQSYPLFNSKFEDCGPTSPQARWKRIIKEKIYLRMPLGIRPLFYFLYRYILRFGFLDGREGYYFHLMQCLWYRTLVDAKLIDIDNYARKNNIDLRSAIKDRTGIDVK